MIILKIERWCSFTDDIFFVYLQRVCFVAGMIQCGFDVQGYLEILNPVVVQGAVVPILNECSVNIVVHTIVEFLFSSNNSSLW